MRLILWSGLMAAVFGCRHRDDASGAWLDVDAVVFRAEYGYVDGALVDVVDGEDTVSPSFYVHILKSSAWTGRKDEENACIIRYNLGAATLWDGEPFDELWTAWRIDASIADEAYGACDQLDPELFGDDVVTWMDSDATWAFGPGPTTDALDAAVAENNAEDWDEVLSGRIAAEYVYRSSHGSDPFLASFYTVEAIDELGAVEGGNYLELADEMVSGYYTSYPVAGLRVSD